MENRYTVPGIPCGRRFDMHKYTIQLRVFGNSMNPDEVTDLLGICPFLIQHRGESRGQANIFKESLWAYAGDLDEEGRSREWDSIEDGVRHIAARISHKDSFYKIVSQNSAIWWCGHFQSSFDGGPTLSLQFIKFLAEFGVPVFIDNYFELLPEDDNSELR
jgi:hypothetical protein